ncbi:MAG: acyl-CoA dehydrogenase family protein [Acidimicrobiales bacterium]
MTEESLGEFATRARRWIERSLPHRTDAPVDNHSLQQLLFDNHFAGIAFPVEYGGAGLTLQHQKVFYDIADDLECQLPTGYELQVSIAMLGPTILDHATHYTKLRFLPPLLRGDEVWIQLLSEPRGGSDMAGATTRLTRDGDSYVLNGAKMWSTGAATADYGLCLCRSDWDVPKHRGLSTIAVPLTDTPGLTIQRIRAANGQLGDFCQEFFDDVTLPADNLIGEENQGWAVAQTLLLHERNAAGNIGHGYLGALRSEPDAEARDSLTSPVALAAVADGRGIDAAVATKVADAYIESVVGTLTSARLMTGLRLGTHKGQWGSLSKLQGAVAKHEALRTALAVLGADGVIWDGAEVEYDNIGTTWLGVRGGTLAGGSNEMQRNIVSERLLGLPREPSFDRDTPFNEVLRNLGKFGS